MSDPSLTWLAAGFGVAWILLGAYLVRLWRAQRDLQRQVAALERRPGAPPDAS